MAVENNIERQQEPAMALPDDEQPLLQANQKVAWSPPPGFTWIQLGKYIPTTSLQSANKFR